jgi:hypothetical protein
VIVEPPSAAATRGGLWAVLGEAAGLPYAEAILISPMRGVGLRLGGLMRTAVPSSAQAARKERRDLQLKGDLRTGNHQPEYNGDCDKRGNAKGAPVPKDAMILIGKRSAGCSRCCSQVAQAHLHPDNG